LITKGMVLDSPDEGRAGFTMTPNAMYLDPRISSIDIHIYGVIVGFSGQNGGCWACKQTLVDLSGLKEATVKRSIRHLKQADYLVEIKDSRLKSGRVLRVNKSPSREGSPPLRQSLANARKAGGAPRISKGISTDPAGRSPRIPEGVSTDPLPITNERDLIERDLSYQQPNLAHEARVTLLADGVGGDHEPLNAIRLGKMLAEIEATPSFPKRRKLIDAAAQAVASLYLDDLSLDHYRKVLWTVVRPKQRRTADDVIRAFKTVEADLPEGKIRTGPGPYFFGCLGQYDRDRDIEEERIEQGLTAVQGLKNEFAGPDENDEPQKEVDRSIHEGRSGRKLFEGVS
jgi:hypothetical protein